MTNDYISREDAIKVINQGRLTKLIDADVAESGLKNLPAADVVQVRHGHWTLVGWHKGMKVMECSCCKKRAIGATDFCPNCGAKMDREE